MKKLFLLLALSLACFGQLTSSVSSTALKPGQSALLTISTPGSGPAVFTGLQWDWTLAGLTPATPTLVANLATKTLVTNASVTRSILYGATAATQGPVSNGPLATLSVTVPAGTPPGILNIGATAPVAADATGSGVAIVASPLVSITVLPLTLVGDLNGDGKVDLTDENLEILQIFGGVPCTNGDLNGDGVCNIKDLNLIAKQL